MEVKVEMKQRVKAVARRIVAFLLVAAMTVMLFPKITGSMTVSAAESASAVKNKDNTCLGTSGIAGPKDPRTDEDTAGASSPWSGSYVYFGQNNGRPIRFRVLAPKTTTYGGSTLFLDSDETLLRKRFNNRNNVWNGSEIQSWLNDDFITNAFTSLENSSIAVSKVESKTYDDTTSYGYNEFKATTGLSQNGKEDRVFLLDASEAMSPAYGYSPNHTSAEGLVNCRIKMNYTDPSYPFPDDWWLRSAIAGSEYQLKYVGSDGCLRNDNHAYSSIGVAPALNIDQSSIIFSSIISDTGKFNEVGTEYKLTIKDPNLSISVPTDDPNRGVTVSGSTVTIPYDIGGSNKGEATRASVLVTDKEWDASGATILYYDALGTSTDTSGTFTLPEGCVISGWGTDYHVYVLAEVVNEGEATDYASVPVPVKLTTYTIKFVDEDGTELQSSQVAYGETPKYTGETPTKKPDAQHTYTFAGWTPEIVPVTGDTTYTATYSTTVNEYTIKFVDEDGTELQSGKLWYGETPTYNGETPSKKADAQYTYTFAGWTPEIAKVTGDATYTATYASTVNEYTIKFVDEDGTELQSGKVAYGETPKYTGETPTKKADAQYTYVFAGWTPEIIKVTGDATYTAKYSNTAGEYTIKFVDEDGTELQSGKVAYGETPKYTGETPTKKADAQYTYAFAGWTPEIAKVTGDATYKATYSNTVGEYTIKFVDEDGTELQSGKVAYGETPAYKGAAPAKATDTRYTYTFTDWTPEIAKVTGDATYKATYKAELIPFTYTIVGGANSSWKKGTGADLVVTVKRSVEDELCFSHFTGVEIDGVASVRDTQYDAKSGSAVITLKNSYLETLGDGTHTIRIIFDDAEISTQLTIQAADKKEVVVSPKTGDAQNIAVLSVIMILSAAVCLVALKSNKKRRRMEW